MNSFSEKVFSIDNTEDYSAVSIRLASPETIRSWSYGEVKNPETINYRTYKPERGGLFCERIFGPQRDWECSCGKYKRIKHKGVICDRCGVEVTSSRVRRERMGHIELVVPVSHIWFFRSTPSRLGLMLDMSILQLERVLYYQDYMVVDPGDTPLRKKQLLNDDEYREAIEKYGNAFVAKMGAEAVHDLLKEIDLDKLFYELEAELESARSKQRRKKIAKRLNLVEGFRRNNTRPEWMILHVLPVIPPDLRPLVPLEGGRFATSDLNDLYRRVINRNNRLRSLMQAKTPEVILRNEKRMLQEAVDAVFDNGRLTRHVVGAANRPLKSLSDMLRGKTGRFRQNLLGKRVDYSGRSVIVVGPELKLHQCGLPKKMALVLFEPFIIKVLKDKGIVNTVRSAKKLIEKQSDEVWDALEMVIKDKTVMLNRAPTLHRLSIQSFEPVLIEGDAIQIHPLVCTGYNADFDGDQMAVHVPLSIEAQLESRLLMLSTNNIFSPSSGKPITTPTQDITLGVYYLTSFSQKDKKVGLLPSSKISRVFKDYDEVRMAYEEGVVKLHDIIRFANPDYGHDTVYGDKNKKIIETTVGRVLFNNIWPKELGFVNAVVDKGKLSDMIWHCYNKAGHERTIKLLDDLKTLGFEFATQSGISIGIDDLIVPDEKNEIILEAVREVEKIEKQYSTGIITEGERHNKIVDIWTKATDEISNAVYKALDNNKGKDELNPLFVMVDSKARGSKQQVRQLAGIRGLMVKPSGEILEHPILSNFREGLSVLEYFISTHGARKGSADTALKTADAGYLTRKLVDVAHDLLIVEHDCGTVNGIEVTALAEGEEILITLGARIVGRTALHDIEDPHTKEIITRAGELIDEAAVEKINKAGIEKVEIRSVLTCESTTGVCAKCYGRDLTTGKLVEVGTAIGIIAAQSIGEPGTQLTMRTFHIGGTASSIFKEPEIKVKNDGRVEFVDLRVIKRKEGDFVVLNKNGCVIIRDVNGRELERYGVSIGTTLKVSDGSIVKKDDLIAYWDPYSVPVLAEVEGRVRYKDMVEDVTVKMDVDEATGLRGVMVLGSKGGLHPQILITDEKDEIIEAYSIPAGAYLVVKNGEKVTPGTILAKTPRKESKTRDITGGLPRVSELFEARTPKDACEIAKIEGIVDFGPVQRGKRKIIIRDPETDTVEEHEIPLGKHVVVFKGDRVKKGQPLTEGSIIPLEILEICGPQDLQSYLLREIQTVYRLQGVEINDKHIECIVRQMLKRVRITNPGDTEFLWGERVTKQRFREVNEKAIAEGKRPAEATPCLLGITKAALETDSFISAASFQDTTRVLTESSSLGAIDYLKGFKENVIIGHLIPGGTGFKMYRQVKIVPLVEPVAEGLKVSTKQDEDELEETV